MSQDRRQIERQAHAMDSSMEGMAILQSDLYIYMNPAHAAMYGFSVEELIGCSWRNLYDDDEIARLEREVFPRLGADLHWTGEVKGRKKDGERFDVELNLTIIPTGDLVCACRDITDRKRVEVDIARKTTLLMAIRDMQSRFMLEGPRNEVARQTLALALSFSASECGVIGEFAGDGASGVQFKEHARECASANIASNPQVAVSFGRVGESIDLVLSTGRSAMIEVPPAGTESRPHCLLALPIFNGASLVGAVGLAKREGGCDERLIEFLEPLLSSYGGIIAARRNEDSRREAEAALTESRDELRRANIELERASRMKDEFLAAMSHELRTPLTAILGLTEALQLESFGSLNEDQTRYLGIIGESGQHLLELINDVLDLAKIGAGQMELEFEDCSLRALIADSINMVRPLADAKRIEMHSADAGEVSFLGDPRRLRQVLVNLLSNAVKFTPHSGRVGVDCRIDGDGGTLSLGVWDTGIGIAEENFDKLFKPFTQIDARLSRQYAGTGLGLSLVAKLVEMHAGSVNVRSRLGQGSRFEVTLPLLRPVAVEAKPIEFLPDGSTGPRRRILIAEDNDHLRMMLEDYLTRCGFAVSSAVNGQEAVDMAVAAQPQLILMDIQMPKMDGIEAIRQIRGGAGPQAGVPIIALTALAMPGDEQRCRSAGADDYIVKPCALPRLLEVVAHNLATHGQRRARA
ncbi:MAG: ATP-binding protein [Methylotetracoccus sp.]